jgi:hypothetical protein
MEKIYEITKVRTLVTYHRYDLDEKGTKNSLHVQTRIIDGLPTKEELVEEATERCVPEENIKVVVDENLKE